MGVVAVRHLVLIVLLLATVTAVSAAPVTFSGRVVDEDGQPVAGAQVWLIRHVTDRWRSEGHLLGETQTDAAGNFSLPDVDIKLDEAASHLFVAAYRPGLAVGWLNVRWHSEAVEIVLPPPLSGQVISEAGEGLAAVKIEPQRLTAVHYKPQRSYLLLPEVLMQRLAVTSDQQGNFTYPLDAA